MLPDPSSFIHSFFLSFFQSGKNLYFHQIKLFVVFFFFSSVRSDKNPLWKSKHSENKKEKEKRKCLLRRNSACYPGVYLYTHAHTHTQKKKKKKKETKGGRRKKGVLFDGQEGWHRLFLLIIAFRYSGYIFASSHDPLMLFPPKERRHSPGIREAAFNTNKGFVLGVFKTEQRLRRSSFPAQVWAFIFFQSRYSSGKR